MGCPQSTFNSFPGGFGRAIGEVGAIMIVGGNIDNATRVLTTAIALETSKGDFALALALGFVLILIAIALNLATHWLSKTEKRAVGNVPSNCRKFSRGVQWKTHSWPSRPYC